MKRMLKMLRDEDGAVTVDWVVLTAAVVMLGMLIAPMLKSPVSNLAHSNSTGRPSIALMERPSHIRRCVGVPQHDQGLPPEIRGLA